MGEVASGSALRMVMEQGWAGAQREPRAWAVMAVRNTSWSAMLLPFQVELKSMRVKLRLTVACGSASYLNASLLMICAYLRY